MKRFELLIGFLLGFATLLIIFILSSDFAAHYEICEPTKEGVKDCASYNVLSYALHKIGTALDSYNGLITAVATAFIAWFTLSLRRSTDKLWDAGEKQFELLSESAASQSRDMQASIAAATAANNLNRRSFESVHRPQLRLKHLWLISDFVANEKLIFKSAFVNRGIGVAQLIEFGIRTWVIRPEENLPPHPEFEAKLAFPVEYGELASGITMEMPYMTDGRVLTPEEEVSVRNSTKMLVCAGVIIYKDSSGPRTTAFCRQLEVSRTLEPGKFVHRIDSDYNYED